jgi:hypothetical protein
MTDYEICALKESYGRIVEIYCKDGQIIQARVLFVSEPFRDVTYDLISTNRPDRYQAHGAGAAWNVSFDDIQAIEGC